MTACENGYGKRTPIDDYPTKGRGGQGVIAIKTSERNGQLVKAVAVTGDEDVILISDKGTLVRTPVAQIATAGRTPKGSSSFALARAKRWWGLPVWNMKSQAMMTATANMAR